MSPLSLAQAFLAKGTRQVIASYWAVDSEASAVFSTAFYRSLRTSGDASRALLDARKVLRNNPLYRHPYYWAVYARLV